MVEWTNLHMPGLWFRDGNLTAILAIFTEGPVSFSWKNRTKRKFYGIARFWQNLEYFKRYFENNIVLSTKHFHLDTKKFLCKHSSQVLINCNYSHPRTISKWLKGTFEHPQNLRGSLIRAILGEENEEGNNFGVADKVLKIGAVLFLSFPECTILLLIFEYNINRSLLKNKHLIHQRHNLLEEIIIWNLITRYGIIIWYNGIIIRFKSIMKYP